MSTVFEFIKLNWWKLLIGLFVLLISVSFFNKRADTSNATIKPSRENIKRIVEVSGNVKATEESDLSFERSGTIASINVKVGDKVKQGQVLASLSGGDAYAQVLEAKAQLDVQRATLNQLKSGATSEERRIKEQAVENAKQDLRNAEEQISDTVKNTNNTLRDIFDFRLGTFFRKDNTLYRATFTNCDQTVQFDLENTRLSFDALVITNLDEAYQNTLRTNEFITKLNSAVNAPCVAGDTTLADKRSSISSIKTSISTIFSDISAKRNILQTAKNNLARTERDLELTLAGTDANRVLAQEAAVRQAEARLAQANSQAAKNVIVAPFNGIVTRVDIEKGEISSLSRSSISLISDSAFEIEAKISEADISSIKLNMDAEVSLDAYGENVKFMAVVTNIDPAATNEAGSPRYGVTLTFKERDERIKSGMTANADVIVESKDNALVIPLSYVKTQAGGGVVKVKSDKDPKDVNVELGIRGNGKVEVLSGIDENTELLEIAEDGQIKR